MDVCMFVTLKQKTTVRTCFKLGSIAAYVPESNTSYRITSICPWLCLESEIPIRQRKIIEWIYMKLGSVVSLCVKIKHGQY